MLTNDREREIETAIRMIVGILDINKLTLTADLEKEILVVIDTTYAIEAWNRREPIDKIVEQLEDKEKEAFVSYDRGIGRGGIEAVGEMRGLRKAIEIVKGGYDET